MEQFKQLHQMRVPNVVLIAVNISESHWVIVIIHKGNNMYLDSRAGSPYRLFNKSLDSMVDSDINWISIPPCPQQSDGFSCVIFYLWFIQAIVENLGGFRETSGEFIIWVVETEDLERERKYILLFYQG